MYNATNKCVLAAAAAMMMWSCGSSEKFPEARAMSESIDSAMSVGQYALAVELMDSLDKTYPLATQIRTEVLRKRPEAMEGLTLQMIAKADSVLAAAEMTIDTLSGKFEHVENKALVENYYVARDGKVRGLMNATGVEPRLDEEFTFYIIASLQGKKIGLNSISLTIGPSTASSNVIPEGDERSIVTPGGQKAVFSGPDAEELGQLAAANPGAASVLTFRGSKGEHTINLSPAQTTALGDSYKYAAAKKEQRFGSLNREKLERQLQIARNQSANIPRPE